MVESLLLQTYECLLQFKLLVFKYCEIHVLWLTDFLPVDLHGKVRRVMVLEEHATRPRFSLRKGLFMQFPRQILRDPHHKVFRHCAELPCFVVVELRVVDADFFC